MTRQLQLQKGHVSDPIKTQKGIAFKIRYRVPAANGTVKHRRETLYGLSGKKAARAVLNERINALSTTSNQEASELTLAEFIPVFWKPKLNRKRVKPSTVAGYESVLSRHILPVLGDMCIGEITPLNIEEYVQKKTAEKLSGRTIRNHLMILRGIFSAAGEQDIIQRSPVRNSHIPEIEKKRKQIWSPDQVRQIIESAPERHKPLIALVALTGTRLGELLALQWKHVEFQSGFLEIAQSLWRGQIVPPKTQGSVRTIPLGPVLVATLQAHYRGSFYRGREDFIFCKEDGSPLHADVIRKDVLYPILDRLGIERKRGESGFHAFRHCAASFINNETGNLKLAQSLLGHTSLSTTADIYTHNLTMAEREASEALEKAVFGNLFPVVPNLGTGNRNSIN